ncbi:MAG TPA: hypothetical protein PK530_01430, partial [Anaerolineales bacterium]|nr:hypothetical protein [Anaerolineales bacterium]
MTTRLTPSSPAELKQRVLYITLIAAGANFIAVLEYVYFAYTANAWQMYVLAFNTTLLAFTGIVGAVLARRGQSERGIQILLIAGAIAFGVAPFFVSGMGIVYGGGIAILIAMIAWQTLPNKQARQMTGWGIGAGLVAFSTDLTGLLAYRFPAPSIVSSGVFLLIALSVLSFGYYNLREYRNYNLQSKLVVLIISLVVLSGGTIAFVANRLTEARLSEQIGGDIYQIAKGQASEVGTFLLNQLHVLESVSHNQGIDEALAALIETRPSTLENIQPLEAQWHTADLENNDADPLVAAVLNNGITEELQEFRSHFPEFVEVFITDPYGATVASTRRISNYYHGDQPWWQATYNNGLGAIHIEKPEYDPNSQAFALRIAFPIFDEKSQKLIGVLHSSLDIELLLSILREARFAQTGNLELRFSEESILNPATEGVFEQLSQADIVGLTQITDNTGNILYKGQQSLVSQTAISVHETEHEGHSQVIESL